MKKMEIYHSFNNIHQGIFIPFQFLSKNVERILCTVFSPNMKFVLTGSFDRSIGVFDVKRKRLCRRIYETHQSIVLKEENKYHIKNRCYNGYSSD